MIASVNPATGETFAVFEPHPPEQVERRIEAAWTAQRAWRGETIERRTELLCRIAAALRADAPRLAGLITAEMGKPIGDSLAEIEKCAVNCDHYAGSAEAMLADTPIAGVANTIVAHEPLGVVLAIMPWNYPFWQAVRFLAPALAAGNAALLKHAANVPQCALALEALVLEAGAPEGLFANLFIEPAAVAAVIADRRVAAITLTGSTEVGMIVAAQAAGALKKQVLELGGSDPFVVLADADMERTAEAAVKARFTNCGQSCINAKRFIVEAGIAPSFTAAFAAEMGRQLRVGDPRDSVTTLGPLARANLRNAIHDQVLRTVAAGGRLVTGGEMPDGPGFYYPPTLIDEVAPGMAAFDEETFGPAAAIIRAADAEEAVALANRTSFGLGASIWTGDRERGARLARRIDAGSVFVNQIVASDPRVPFGGIKHSGYGRELGELGLKEFTNAKTIRIA
jgi:succinate-semialdehyde dehydrogenase/glutarate-semialdehyde dehydrogenase